MKPEFTFHFDDQPQFKVSDRRSRTANDLRAYRKHPERYQIKRAGLHCYHIKVNPWRDNCPTAIIQISQ
jgi:hypothetical protein